MNVMMMNADIAADQGVQGQKACAGTRSRAPNDAGSGRDASYAKIFETVRTAQDSDPSDTDAFAAEGFRDETADHVDVAEEDAAAGLALGHILQQTRDHEWIRHDIEAAFMNRDRSMPGVSEAQTLQNAEASGSGLDKPHGMHLAVGQILQGLRTQQAGVYGDNLPDEPGAAISDLNADFQIAVEDGQSSADSPLLQTMDPNQEKMNQREAFSQMSAHAFEDAPGRQGADCSEDLGKIPNPAANAEKHFAVAAQNQTQVLKPEFSMLRSQQIVDQVLANSQQIFNQGTGRIKLALNPPNLGTVDMDVRLLNQKVEVIMVTARTEVQQALQSHADQIKSAFQAQGIQVDSYDVLCFSDSDPRSFEGNAFTRGDRGNTKNGHSLGGENSSIISRKTIQITDDSGISVFA